MLPYCATNHGLRKPEGAYRGDGYYNTLLSSFCQPLFYRNFQKSTEYRDYITSLTEAEQFAYAVRQHWSIENQLHWRLDVIFREEANRVRKDLSPLNLNVLRSVALALCRNASLASASAYRSSVIGPALTLMLSCTFFSDDS